MKNQFKHLSTLERPSKKQYEESMSQEKDEPDPKRYSSKQSKYQLEPRALYSKELLSQGNIF